MQNLAKMIDHTLLYPFATSQEIENLCSEAHQWNFMSVCVNPFYVSLAKRLLMGSKVKVCTVIGFPLGATTPPTKVFETREVIKSGADEVDMVICLGALKSGQYGIVAEDIRGVVMAAESRIVKVIIETCYLTREEKLQAVQLAMEEGAHFIKTSTGFGTTGATAEDIQLIKQVVGNNMGIKAAGGIKNLTTALYLIEAGATRIGTSRGVDIIQEWRERQSLRRER